MQYTKHSLAEMFNVKSNSWGNLDAVIWGMEEVFFWSQVSQYKILCIYRYAKIQEVVGDILLT